MKKCGTWGKALAALLAVGAALGLGDPAAATTRPEAAHRMSETDGDWVLFGCFDRKETAESAERSLKSRGIRTKIERIGRVWCLSYKP